MPVESYQFPDYPPDGSLRRCRRAKLLGLGGRTGVWFLLFGVEGEPELVRLLLSGEDVRWIADRAAENHSLTNVQSDKSSGRPAFEGSPDDGQSQVPPTKSSSAWRGE